MASTISVTGTKTEEAMTHLAALYFGGLITLLLIAVARRTGTSTIARHEFAHPLWMLF